MGGRGGCLLNDLCGEAAGATANIWNASLDKRNICTMLRREEEAGMEGRKERKAGKTRGHGTHIIPPLEQSDGAELPVPSHQPQTQRLDPPACLHVCVCLLCSGVKATSLLFAPPPAFAQPPLPPSNELLAFCSVTTTARITDLESPETSSKWKCQPLTSANRWTVRLDT